MKVWIRYDWDYGLESSVRYVYKVYSSKEKALADGANAADLEEYEVE